VSFGHGANVEVECEYRRSEGPRVRAYCEVTPLALVKASASAGTCDARKGRESACDDQQERTAAVLLFDGFSTLQPGLRAGVAAVQPQAGPG
jgi:hypothetical protein